MIARLCAKWDVTWLVFLLLEQVVVGDAFGWNPPYRDVSSSFGQPQKRWPTTLYNICPSSITEMAAWSRQAEFDDGKSCESIVVQPPATKNLSSPRAWLESHPHGVYTVLRVELEVQSPLVGRNMGKAPTTTTMHVWGIDFHMDRLEQNYQTWRRPGTVRGKQVALARKQSQDMLQTLLQAAAADDDLFLGDNGKDEEDTPFMATLLWHPFARDDNELIQVRGHLLQLPASGAATPKPILATLAMALPTKDAKSRQLLLPNRGIQEGLADCKRSSWCQERKPLETQFRRPNVPAAQQEVILTTTTATCLQTCTTTTTTDETPEIQLLEGLTSNLFVVLTDTNVVQTAPTSHVLGGFARHIVCCSLKRLGYTVEEISPKIALQSKHNGDSHNKDFDAPLWQEVFVTSSVKLVVPVSELYDEHGTRLWAYKQNSMTSPLWQRVLQDIHKHREEWFSNMNASKT